MAYSSLAIEDVTAWDGIILSLARKRCRQVGADVDDLRQEGYVEVITRLRLGQEPTEANIINAMRRYLRAVREGRTIEYEPKVLSLLPV